MNRILLAAFIIIISAVSGYSQCTPDPLYADSLFGVWPDTATNFVSGIINEPYFQQLDIAVPSNTDQVPGLDFPFTLAIDSGRVVNVIGLPNGLSFACASHTPAACTFLGGAHGCAIVEGTPTESGIFPITVLLEAYVIGFPSEVEFEGYQILVENPLGLEDELIKPQLDQNVPNPFVVRTSIPFSVGTAEVVEFKVMDLLGQEVYTKKVDAKFGSNEFVFEPSNLESGIYLYSINSSAGTLTRRMVYDRP